MRERLRALDLGFAPLVPSRILVQAQHRLAPNVPKDLFKVHRYLHLQLVLPAPQAVIVSSDAYHLQDQAFVLLGHSPLWAVAQLQLARLAPQENIVFSAALAPLVMERALLALILSKAQAWLRVAFLVRPGDTASLVPSRFQDLVFVHLEHTLKRAPV